MQPIPFHSKERVLSPPTGQHEEISGLRVVDLEYSDGSKAIVSCWELSEIELDQVSKTGRVYLVVQGQTQPPAYLTADGEELGL